MTFEHSIDGVYPPTAAPPPPHTHTDNFFQKKLVRMWGYPEPGLA